MSANRSNIGWHLHEMLGDKVAGTAVTTIYKEEGGILQCFGNTVPVDGTADFAPGCIFHHADGASGGLFYVNEGSATSCSFKPLQSVEGIQATYLADTADDGGHSPLLWDDALLLEVLLNPAKGYHFFSDFMEGDFTSTASHWTLTQRSSGTQTNGVEQGGVTIFDAGAATQAQGITCQMHGLSIKPEPGTTIRMEWRCKIDEDDGRVVMGLGAVGTTDWNSTDTVVVNADNALFYRDAGTGATDWSVQICDGSTVQATDDEFEASDAGYETYGIKIIGDGTDAADSVTFYRNGVADTITTDVGDMPDAVMVPTFEVNADGTDQPVLVLDWLRILVTNATDGSRA